METKILVIDDNPDIIDTIRAVLSSTQKKMEITGATSGKDGLDAMRQTQPDLVILDLMMPQMTGWDVASAMKEDSSLKDIPIIFLTANNDELSRDMGEISGDDYIVKPFDSVDLKRCIDNVLLKTNYVKSQIKLFK